MAGSEILTAVQPDGRNISFEYLAGIIDGEGCFDINTQLVKNRFVQQPIRLRIGMADPEPIMTIAKEFGGHVRLETKRSGNRRNLYCYSLGRESLAQLLPKIIPFLITKKRHAEVLLLAYNITKNMEYCDQRIEIVKKLATEISGLNSRGKAKCQN